MRKSSRIMAQPAIIAPPRIVNKPKPVVGASCGHKCEDKAACSHKCCQVPLILAAWPSCDDFINSPPVLVCLLESLPVEDLFRLRHVNKTWKDTIETSTAFRQAAFLESEPTNETFHASIKEALLEPVSKYQQTDAQRFWGVKEYDVIDAPSRQVRINPFLFATSPCWYRNGLRYPEPENFSSDGAPLWTSLVPKFDAIRDVDDKSSCMEMFLTQPPVKEVIVDIHQRATHVGYGWVEEHTIPLLLSTDGDGLRYRDLHKWLNSFRGLAGFEMVAIIDGPGIIHIPRCEAIGEHVMPRAQRKKR
ncbi:unnamed protein product [Zymoseptoria tritici ST99CH_3D7]|uniref:F-box domain-containing protein n=1 Tax=Zymoseptoria tritici (strain ST99CH_3D7) TaxID=1276538 RepID=A0A1X7RZB2_ZYMT9|nr:unnamed protein product [Zymoseptoria tritici ST99CH_3D7]